MKVARGCLIFMDSWTLWPRPETIIFMASKPPLEHYGLGLRQLGQGPLPAQLWLGLRTVQWLEVRVLGNVLGVGRPMGPGRGWGGTLIIDRLEVASQQCSSLANWLLPADCTVMLLTWMASLSSDVNITQITQTLDIPSVTSKKRHNNTSYAVGTRSKSCVMQKLIITQEMCVLIQGGLTLT